MKHLTNLSKSKNPDYSGLRNYLGMVPILICLFSFCNGNSQAFDEEWETGEFNRVELAIAADLYISPGNKNSCKLEASANDLNDIIVENMNGKLFIRHKNKWANTRNIKIYITAVELKGLSVSGSGKIIVGEQIKTDKMDLHVSGSGKITVPFLNADNLNSSVAGSGSIQVQKGNIDKAKLTISGSGDIQAENLECSNVSVVIGGSGDVKVYAADELHSTIAGSGNVYYRGNATVKLKVTGSGKIVKI